MRNICTEEKKQANNTNHDLRKSENLEITNFEDKDNHKDKDKDKDNENDKKEDINDDKEKDKEKETEDDAEKNHLYKTIFQQVGNNNGEYLVMVVGTNAIVVSLNMLHEY